MRFFTVLLSKMRLYGLKQFCIKIESSLRYYFLISFIYLFIDKNIILYIYIFKKSKIYDSCYDFTIYDFMNSSRSYSKS